MIRGVVTPGREARVRVAVRAASGDVVQSDAVIDTGFTGHLALPARTISSLGLSYAGTTQATLADASRISMDVFEATVRWDDQEREVLILAVEGFALVGMALLTGYRLVIDVQDRGDVRIEALE